jgi:hypothetical protein
MICGCCKDLGCFVPDQDIDFGILAISTDPYTFHIWSNGSYTTITETYNVDDPVVLPFTFNENGETTIKIQFPASYISSIKGDTYGINYVTTKDGACCFTVHGIIPICQ